MFTIFGIVTNVFTRIFSATPTPCPLPTEIPAGYGIPTWYKYLQGYTDPTVPGGCSPFNQKDFSLAGIDSLAGIGLAVIEIMLRIGGIVAVAYIVYGGFQYLISQGEPDRARSAKETILNALIGLVIAITANVIVVFIGTRLTT